MPNMGRILLAALTATLAFAFPALAHTQDDPASFPLVYGATEIQIGWVNVWNDAATLHVEFEIIEAGWGLTQTHLLVTLTPILWTGSDDYPPGQYTYQHPFTSPYPTTDEYQVTSIGHGQFGKDSPFEPVGSLHGTTLYLVAHASVVGPAGQQETAFGNGFRNANTIFTYDVQSDPVRPPSVPALPLLAIPAGLAIAGLVRRRSREAR